MHVEIRLPAALSGRQIVDVLKIALTTAKSSDGTWQIRCMEERGSNNGLRYIISENGEINASSPIWIAALIDISGYGGGTWQLATSSCYPLDRYSYISLDLNYLRCIEFISVNEKSIRNTLDVVVRCLSGEIDKLSAKRPRKS